MVCLVFTLTSEAQELVIESKADGYSVSVRSGNKTLLRSPAEGLWSVATSWKDGWTADWHHGEVTEVKVIGEWKEVSGRINLPQGEWDLRDSYRKEGNKIKCIRRFKWSGSETLEHVTLSVRWIVPSAHAMPFLPGILYYGNPSG